MKKTERKLRWHPLKMTAWLISLILVVAAICEGTYLLIGDTTFGRIVCTAALLAVSPVFLKPLIWKASDSGEQTGDSSGTSPADKHEQDRQ